MSGTQDTPGLISSHAAYAKGAAAETIGNLTGSEAWKESGKADQESAKKDMHAATQSTGSTTDSGLAGKMESKIGAAAGCPPMAEQEQSKQ